MANPILARELKTYTRSIRSRALRTGFVGVLVVVVIAAWSDALSGGDLASGGLVGVKSLPRLGRELFSTFATALAVLLVLVVPAYVGGSICVERERGTLELTLASQLRARGVVWAKFAAAMAWGLMLLAGSLPVMGATFLLGGVSGAEIAWLAVLLVATAAAAAALSLYWSSAATRAHWAVIATLATIAAAHFIVPPLMRAICEVLADKKALGLVSGWQMVADLAARCSPFNALRELLAGQAASERWLQGLGEGWQVGIRQWAYAQGEAPVFLLGLAVLLLKRTTVRISRLDVDRRTAWTARLWAKVMAPSEARPRARVRAGRWSRLWNRLENPVLAKELRSRSLGQPRWLAPAGYLAILLAQLAIIVAPAWMINVHQSAAILAWGVVFAALLSGAVAATSVASERERGTLGFMIATPLRVTAIAAGKLMASLVRVQPWLLLLVPLALMAGAVNALSWESIAWTFALAEALCLASACIGLLTSVLCRRSSYAVMATLVAMALIGAGPVCIKRLGLMSVVGQIVPGYWPPWVAENLLSVMAHGLQWDALKGDVAHVLLGMPIVIAGVAYLLALAALRRLLRRGVEEAAPRQVLPERELEPAAEPTAAA